MEINAKVVRRAFAAVKRMAAGNGRFVAADGSCFAEGGRLISDHGRLISVDGRPAAGHGRPVAGHGRPAAGIILASASGKYTANSCLLATYYFKCFSGTIFRIKKTIFKLSTSFLFVKHGDSSKFQGQIPAAQ